MTPWQSLIESKAMSERCHEEARAMMSQAWHTAAFYRSKRMPPLRRVIGDTDRKVESPDDLVAALKQKFGVANG